MKRFFRPTSTGVASGIIAAATLISYVIGVVRDKTMAYYFGTAVSTDTYTAAFIIPDIILALGIAGALSGVFIPVYVKHMNMNQKDADELGSIFLSVMSLVVLMMSALAFVFADQLTWILIPDQGGALVNRAEVATSTALMMRIVLLNPLLLGLSKTFGGILQAHQHFVSYSLSFVLYNIGIIAGVLFFHESIGIYSAGVGAVIGAFLHMLIQGIELKTIPFQYTWNLNIFHAGFKHIIALMFPRILTLVSLQLVLIAYSIYGFQLQEGALYAANLARNFQSFSISLFGVAIATASLPVLSKFAAAKDDIKFDERVHRSMIQILFFTIPSAVGMILLSEPIISVFLKGGAFTQESVFLTSMMLLIYSLSIPVESLMHLYSRVFYAKTLVAVPTIASLIFASIAIGSIVLLTESIGVLSFAAGWALGTLAQTALLMLLYRLKLHGTVFTKEIMIEIVKITCSAVFMGIGVYAITQVTTSSIIQLVLGVIVGGVIFFTSATLLRINQLESSIGFLTRKFPFLKKLGV